MQIRAYILREQRYLPVVSLQFGRVDHKLTDVEVQTSKWSTHMLHPTEVRLEYSTDGVEWKEL